MGAPVITFDHVTKTYPAQPKKPALSDVTLQIFAGEFIFLVGPSGSGKSTCARLAARLWDVLMELLDRFAAALADIRLSPNRHLELFRLVAGVTDLGSSPQSLDAVQVGCADRMRFSRKDATTRVRG
ncbi:MAG: hypothetical protein BHW58_00660 [Azospirillum sp. 51_20]|nr:MAG: hypothetical protein BHW58_00660 [Azospirillum sp. 51_20]